METVFLMLLTNWKGEEKYPGQWVETGVEDRSKMTFPPHHGFLSVFIGLSLLIQKHVGIANKKLFF